MHPRRFFAAAKFLEKGEAGPWPKRRVTSFDRFAKDRLVRHQFTSHAPPLRPLSAHDESDTRRFLSASRESRANFRAVSVFRKGVEFLGQFRPIARHKG